MRRVVARLLNLLRPGAAEREMAREIEAHLALMQEEFERRGLPPKEAWLAAQRAYGGVEQAKELHRQARSFVGLEQSCKDVRHGVRSLLRTPGFTAVAVLTLALGIGANTAIFSVVKAVLLEPLPYRDADRLVTILHGGTNPVAPANFLDWRDQTRSFQAMAAAEAWNPNLTRVSEPEQLRGLRVSANLLPMLGIDPLLGRLFRPGEDLPGAEREVILSHGLWQRRFGGKREILGETITLNGQAYSVVGVMPPSFRFAPFWATRAELWVPLAFGPRLHDRAGNSLRVFARLQPGISLAQARADVSAVTARLERQYPGTNRDAVVTPLKQQVVGNVEARLLVMLVSVGLVLLIACANVAHMLLARTADRAKEIAVRAALGAGRARIARQFLTESLLLAGLGAAGGLLAAVWGTRALVALSPAAIPRVDGVRVDSGVILFLLGVAVFTALLFGLAPALHATSGSAASALKDGGRGGSSGRGQSRLRGFLVASEFALAFMLLTGAGLMLRSFVALQSVDPGFDPRNVLSMVVSVAGSPEAEPGRREALYTQLVERLRTLPGVTAASGINHLPLAGDAWGLSFAIEGRTAPRAGESPNALYRVAMPGYFETMGMRLRRGRFLSDRDDSRASRVVVINERAARAYWPGEDPLGQRISFGAAADPTAAWLTIVGVVADAKQLDWTSDPSPEVYVPALQDADFLGRGGSHTGYITLVMRAAGDPAALAPAVKHLVWSIGRDLPVSDVLVMERVVADATAEWRFEMLLLGVFAGLALVLAAVGIYGVVAYSVARRVREIGIRLALGATRSDVIGMVVRQGLTQTGLGTLAGGMGALLLARFMAGMLYGVQATDPVTFGGVTAVLAAAALGAACVPALRATRVEPVTALRSE